MLHCNVTWAATMLVTLSMVFCLISDPTQCRTVTPLIPDDYSLSMSSCPLAGQTEGAKWVEEHPRYRMTRVRCSVGNKPPEKDA